MDDLVVLRLHRRRVDAPARRRRLLQHLPHGGAALAHRLQEVADAARSVGVLVAVSRFVAGRLLTIFTRDQSASISSATIIGRLVRGPGPISARWAMIVTSPDGSIDTNTCGSFTVPCGIKAAPVAYSYAANARRGSSDAPTTSAPEATSPFSRKRRLTFSTAGASTARDSIPSNGAISNPRRSKPHGGGDALVAAATADIAGHGAEDFLIRRMRRLLQQRGCLHDLSGLAIAALRHVQFAPGLLDRMVALRMQPLDGDDLVAHGIADHQAAGPRGLRRRHARCRRRTALRRSRIWCRSVRPRPAGPIAEERKDHRHR